MDSLVQSNLEKWDGPRAEGKYLTRFAIPPKCPAEAISHSPEPRGSSNSAAADSPAYQVNT